MATDLGRIRSSSDLPKLAVGSKNDRPVLITLTPKGVDPPATLTESAEGRQVKPCAEPTTLQLIPTAPAKPLNETI